MDCFSPRSHQSSHYPSRPPLSPTLLGAATSPNVVHARSAPTSPPPRLPRSPRSPRPPLSPLRTLPKRRGSSSPRVRVCASPAIGHPHPHRAPSPASPASPATTPRVRLANTEQAQFRPISAPWAIAPPEVPPLTTSLWSRPKTVEALRDVAMRTAPWSRVVAMGAPLGTAASPSLSSSAALGGATADSEALGPSAAKETHSWVVLFGGERQEAVLLSGYSPPTFE